MRALVPGDRPEEGAKGTNNALLADLQALAAEAGVEVRIEPFTLQMAGKGGLCRIRGTRVILVDAKLSVLEQVGVIGEALRRALPKGTPIPEALAPYLRTGHGKVPRIRHLLRPLARGR